MHPLKKVWVLLICFVILWSCGYRMVGKETHVPAGLTSIAIPTFKNKTFEPGIEIPFTQAFLNEFIQDRRVQIKARESADAYLEGVINSFRIRAASFDRGGLALEYQVIVVIDVTLKKRTGETLWVEKNLSETRWFRASSEVLVSEGNKAAAVQQIGRFAAERIRNRVFYNF